MIRSVFKFPPMLHYELADDIDMWMRGGQDGSSWWLLEATSIEPIGETSSCQGESDKPKIGTGNTSRVMLDSSMEVEKYGVSSKNVTSAEM